MKKTSLNSALRKKRKHTKTIVLHIHLKKEFVCRVSQKKRVNSEILHIIKHFLVISFLTNRCEKIDIGNLIDHFFSKINLRIF